MNNQNDTNFPPDNFRDWNPRESKSRRPGNRDRRRKTAFKIREGAAKIAFKRPHPESKNNDDEQNLPNFIGNYSKGLPHNDLGEVEPDAYKSLLKALKSGLPEDFEAIQLGTDPNGEPPGRRLINPQAGLAFDLEGPDAQAVTIPPAPQFSSKEEAAEMGEVYWMALLRDVNFTEYDNNSLVAAAAADLSNFSDFRGPKQDDRVTPGTLFRGMTPGDLVGPYISQFLLKDINFGTLTISQRQRTVVNGVDFMTDFDSWLAVQRGVDTSGQDKCDSTPRYIRNVRDLGNYVHFDALYQAYLNACLILLDLSAPCDPSNGARLDRGNPYIDSLTQQGFGTFGESHVLSLVTEVATRALKAVWFQKWFVHRRLRPEAFGGRIHIHQLGQAEYPINEEILNSPVLERIFESNKKLNQKLNRSNEGSYLLPQLFPEGSPTHPAYGAGHATVAGACVTILKAWFDEDALIQDPVVPNADGTSLEPYEGTDKKRLTVGGELNKIAANISIGRNGAGVHWRTDYAESVKLGEEVAIGILQEQSMTYNEDLRGEAFFTLTKFDGKKVKIEDGQVKPV